MHSKILVTAFEPFNQNEINYSEVILKQIEEHPHMIKLVLPVEYVKSFEIVKVLIDKTKISHIVMMGEARNYENISFEMIGKNEVGERADATGNPFGHEKLTLNGSEKHFSTLDENLFIESFKKFDIKINKSLNAGTYVCNALLYQTLNYLKDYPKPIKCGFIHIPILSSHAIVEASKGFDMFIQHLMNQSSSNHSI